jgi:CRISPR-associated exonuclease Cas4
MIRSGRTPPAIYEKARCDHCSLIELCMPRTMAPRRSAGQSFSRILRASLTASAPGHADEDA